MQLLLAEGFAWWAGCVGIWLLTVSSVDLADLEIAVPVGLWCAVVAVATRRVLRATGRLPAVGLRWAARVPAAIVVDGLKVLTLPVRQLRRRPPGRFVRVPVAPGSGSGATGRRTLATLLISLSPGSYVIDEDSGSGELLVHTLVSSRCSMEEVVHR